MSTFEDWEIREAKLKDLEQQRKSMAAFNDFLKDRISAVIATIPAGEPSTFALIFDKGKWLATASLHYSATGLTAESAVGNLLLAVRAGRKVA